MTRLNIDFATSAGREGRLCRPLAGWLAVIGAGLGLWATVNIAELSQTTDSLQKEEDRLAAALSAHAALHRPPPLPPEAQLRAVNQSIRRLNLPWRDLFNALQAAAIPDVALLALEPDAVTHTLKGVAEAATPESMLAYLQALRQTAIFSTVTLSHHEINTADPNKPLRFQFDARWQGSAR